jgi:probable rRNA maturation factor
MPTRPKSFTNGSALELTITAAAVGRRLVPYLRRHLRAAHAMLRCPLRELSVALVGNRRMAELHEQFMGLRGPTDVLTFPLELDKRGRALSGEIAICVPEARRRAKEHRQSVADEVLLYAVHGLLHLCGFDDRTARDFRRMHRREDLILSRLGVGPVFAAGAGASSSDARPASRLATRRRTRAKEARRR